MKQKIVRIILIVILIITTNVTYGTEITDELEKELDLDNVLDSLEEYTKENNLDISQFKEDLVSGKGLDYGVIGNFVKEKILNLKYMLKLPISILLVVIVLAVVKSLELEDKSGLSKITNLVGFLIIAGISLNIYKEQIISFKGAISSVTGIMNVVSPFILGILIATGEIVTSGILSPILVAITGIIGGIITNIVCPLLSISVIFKLISSMSEKISLKRFSELANTTALWIVGIVFAVFLAILELQTTVTTSVDSVTIKTAQAAVSNVVPVVGKFVSDSLEVLMGASQVIGKSVGVIGVVLILILIISPLIEVVFWLFAFSILAALSEMLMASTQITGLFDGFKKVYKTITGLIAGTTVTFVIAIGIVIKLIGNI